MKGTLVKEKIFTPTSSSATIQTFADRYISIRKGYYFDEITCDNVPAIEITQYHNEIDLGWEPSGKSIVIHISKIEDLIGILKSFQSDRWKLTYEELLTTLKPLNTVLLFDDWILCALKKKNTYKIPRKKIASSIGVSISRITSIERNIREANYTTVAKYFNAVKEACLEIGVRF